MASYRARTKKTAKQKAKMLRKKGLKASVYKRKKGYGVSSTRRK